MNDSLFSATSLDPVLPLSWQGSSSPELFSSDSLSIGLRNYSAPLYLLTNGEATHLSGEGTLSLNGSWKILAFLPPFFT